MYNMYDTIVELLEEKVSGSVYEESPLGEAISDVSKGYLKSYLEGSLVGFNPDYLGLTDFEKLKESFKEYGYDLIETTDEDDNTIWGISSDSIRFELVDNSNLSELIHDTINDLSEDIDPDSEYELSAEEVADEIFNKYPEELEIFLDEDLESCMSCVFSQSSKDLQESKEKIFRKVFKESHR